MEYTTPQVARALGIPNERFRQWLKMEFIGPYKPASGQGTIAKYNKEDIYRIYIFQQLVNAGFKRAIAKNISRSISLYDDIVIELSPISWLKLNTKAFIKHVDVELGRINNAS